MHLTSAWPKTVQVTKGRRNANDRHYLPLQPGYPDNLIVTCKRTVAEGRACNRSHSSVPLLLFAVLLMAYVHNTSASLALKQAQPAKYRIHSRPPHGHIPTLCPPSVTIPLMYRVDVSIPVVVTAPIVVGCTLPLAANGSMKQALQYSASAGKTVIAAATDDPNLSSNRQTTLSIVVVFLLHL